MKNRAIAKYLTPDWAKAEQHGKASKIGCANAEFFSEMCPCCFQYIKKDPISLNQNTKQLQFLGFGFPLYFSFLRNCIMLLFLIVCSYNLNSIYQALSENKFYSEVNVSYISHLEFQNSGNPNSVDSFYTTFRKFSQSDFNNHDSKKRQNVSHLIENFKTQRQRSNWMLGISRIQTETGQYQQIIRVASFFIHAFLLVYMRDKLIKMKEYFDQRRTSPSDYSIVMKNLNLVKGQKAAIRRMLTQKLQINSIAEILLVPHLEDFQKLNLQRSKIIQKLKKKISKEKYDQDQQHLQQKMIQIDRQIRQIIVKAKMQYKSDQLITQRAIVIINTQTQKQQLIQKWQKNQIQGWQNVKIVQAPQPKQIIWQNAGLSSKKRKLLVLISWSCSMLVLALIIIIFGILSQYKSQLVLQKMQQYSKAQKNSQNSKLFQASILVYGMILFVVILNKLVISNLFHTFTKLQRHSSTYKFQFSFCLKYSIGLFFTTALMALIIEGLYLKNIYIHDFGLIEQQTTMFCFVSLFTPTFYIINFQYLFKKLQRWLKYGKKGLTQKQANQLMQDPQYHIGKRYAQILKLIWISFLYLTLIPIGGIITCIGLGIYYWVDKYNLLRRSTIKNNISGQLIYLMLKLLDFTLVLRMFGQILFDSQIKNKINNSSWIMLVISIIFQFIPFEKVLQYFFHEKFFPQQKTYMQARFQFHQTYYNNHLLYSQLQEDRQNMASYLTSNINTRKFIQ